MNAVRKFVRVIAEARVVKGEGYKACERSRNGRWVARCECGRPSCRIELEFRLVEVYTGQGGPAINRRERRRGLTQEWVEMHPMGASVIGAPVAAQVAPTAAQGVPPVVYEAVSSDDEVAIPMDSLLIGGEDPHGLYQGELSPATEAGLQ